MPPRVASRFPARPHPARPHPVRPRRGLVVLVGCLVMLAGAACSSGEQPSTEATQSEATQSEAMQTGSTTSGKTAEADPSTPPPGSGATAPGVTPSSAPPIVPQGSTKANIACRQMYPVVNDAITTWNAANSKDSRAELQTANVALSRAADAIPGIASGSGDARLVTLTGATSAQLKKVVGDYSNDRAVNGVPLQQATTALWAYCETTR